MTNHDTLSQIFSRLKYPLIFGCFFLSFTSLQAQFQPTEQGLTIMVSDGTDGGKNSKVQGKSDIPASYDQIRSKSGGSTKNLMVFNDPIRELGMTQCIQAAAFLERPKYGKAGFMLIFSINDAIGGQQATLNMNGIDYKGVYRIIRQKNDNEEPTPKGMATYIIEGTFFLLGIS